MNFFSKIYFPAKKSVIASPPFSTKDDSFNNIVVIIFKSNDINLFKCFNFFTSSSSFPNDFIIRIFDINSFKEFEYFSVNFKILSKSEKIEYFSDK